MKPVVMFGDTRSSTYLVLLRERGWGRMFTKRPTPFPYEKWGFDNGAFVAWANAGFAHGLTVDDWKRRWNGNDYEQRLETAMNCGSDPWLAIVPDIPASPHSLQFSIEWRLNLPYDWPWYLAVQDGMQVEEVEDVLHMFAGLFLGGSDKFKLTAYRWARLAHKHGRKFHYARAGTPRKVKHAYAVQADSLDSTFASWTKARTRKLCAVWDGLGLQQEIFEVANA